jgi:hypothetical protein
MRRYNSETISSISADIVEKALQTRINGLLPGDTLRFAVGTLAVGYLQSISITYVPSGNYVWVMSGRVKEKVTRPPRTLTLTKSRDIIPASTNLKRDLALYGEEPHMDRFTGVASDVVANVVLPFTIANDSIVDWKTYLEVAKTNREGSPIAQTRRYVTDLVNSAVPESYDIFDDMFRVDKTLFEGKNRERWFSTIRVLSLILALLDAKLNYSIPREKYLVTCDSIDAVRLLRELIDDVTRLLRCIG